MAAVVDVDEVDAVVESLVGEVRGTAAALGRKVPAFNTDDLT